MPTYPNIKYENLKKLSFFSPESLLKESVYKKEFKNHLENSDRNMEKLNGRKRASAWILKSSYIISTTFEEFRLNLDINSTDFRQILDIFGQILDRFNAWFWLI